jgi:phospholipase C
MSLQRSAGAVVAAALLIGTLPGCNSQNALLPSSFSGTFESQQMSPHQHTLLVRSLQSTIKYVFVIFQENHSFDNYFGTYPAKGTENVDSAMAKSHGYKQYDTIGKDYQTAFRITNPDILAPNQDRYALEKKFDNYKMDKFISVEEEGDLGYGSSANEARQYGLTTMAEYDCDTIPYLWMYAKNFVLFDHYFQADTGPSTPGNVAMIAAQTGISEEHHFPNLKENPKTELGVPVTGDADPFMGPYTSTGGTHEVPLSFATLPMLYGGASSAGAAKVQGNVGKDLGAVASSSLSPINWTWYQENYKPHAVLAANGYVAHHNAVQYFDYLRQNKVYWSHVSTTQQALSDIQSGKLGPGGVFYIKGSKLNDFGWLPASKNPTIRKNYLGDDDHPGPGDSDHQVAEAFVATYVNAIAKSQYWNQSAIIITWDDDGGFWDHVPPMTFEKCSDGYPCGDGPRLPFILISPFAQSGVVVHDYSDTASIAKFIELLFSLPAMANLPDEKTVKPYGPRDDNPALSDLADAFDLNRIYQSVGPLPASMAEVPDSQVGKFPPAMSCSSLGIKPLSIPKQPSVYNPSLVNGMRMLQYDAQRNASD